MITIDPEFKALIPPLQDDERALLEQNIVRDGCRDPLVVWQGILIDGHNRYEICTRLNIQFETVGMEFEDRNDAKIWILQNQLGRRNLPDFVRVEIVLQLKEFIAARAKENLKRPTGGKRALTLQNSVKSKTNTQHELAKIAGVSHDTIHKVEAVLRDGDDSLKQAARSEKVSINTAATIAELPKDEQREVVAKGEKEILAKAKEIRAAKAVERREERKEKIIEIAKSNTELDGSVGGKFPVIYADPPWRYEHVETESRAIENQYPTMDLDEICALPVADIAMDDCVLFMWATSPKLAESMRVIDAWGFDYRTCMVWIKDKIGMGYYARQRHELLLIAKRGNPITPDPSNRPDSVVEAVRGKHSAKPEVFYELIEQMYPDFPRIELFCRSARDGWAVWGNQSQ